MEITSGTNDYDFDGVDDAWQREHFPVFASAASRAEADPDGDGYVTVKNSAATIQTMSSFPQLEINSITVNENGTTIQWDSLPGKRYQVWSKKDVAKATWKKSVNHRLHAGLSHFSLIQANGRKSNSTGYRHCHDFN